MSATFETARNEIFAIFNTAWVAAGDYTVLWPDVAGTPPEGSEDPWARVQLNHVLGNQNGFGPIAQKRWNREGFLLVQVLQQSVRAERKITNFVNLSLMLTRA